MEGGGEARRLSALVGARERAPLGGGSGGGGRGRALWAVRERAGRGWGRTPPCDSGPTEHAPSDSHRCRHSLGLPALDFRV